MTTLLLHKKRKLTLFDFTRRLSDDHPTVRPLPLGLGQQASLVLRCGKLSFVVLAVFVFSLVYGLAGKKKRLSLRFCAQVATLISTRLSAHPLGAACGTQKAIQRLANCTSRSSAGTATVHDGRDQGLRLLRSRNPHLHHGHRRMDDKWTRPW